MSKKKGGILSLVPLALGAIALGGGFFWLVVGLIIFLCGVSIAPIYWIIGGASFVVGLIVVLIMLIKQKKEKTE